MPIHFSCCALHGKIDVMLEVGGLADKTLSFNLLNKVFEFARAFFKQLFVVFQGTSQTPICSTLNISDTW
jgi:hypothetical protein